MRNLNNVENAFVQNKYLNDISKIFFDKFSGSSLLEIGTGGYLSNGYIYIDVKTDSYLELYYKNIMIFSTNTSSQRLIPCLFENDTYLLVKGDCEDLSIQISGAEIISKKSNYFLPLNNKIIKSFGESYRLYSYNDTNDIMTNNYNHEFDIKDLKYIQSITFNNENHIGYLYLDNQLQFVNSMNNYTNKCIITDSCLNATIVPDKQKNCVYIVYIRENQLFYKIIDENLNLSDEIMISIDFNDIIRGFSNIVIKKFGYPIFAVNLNNNKTLVMLFRDSKVICRLVKKSKNIEIYQDDNILEIFTFDSNLLTISKYEIEEYSSDVCIVSKSKSKQIYNVDRVMKIDNLYLMYNSEYCTEVTNEELFGN